MAHFAKLNEAGNKVIHVQVVSNKIVEDDEGNNREGKGQAFLEKIHGWPAHLWKQTSCNTHNGIHTEGRTPLRKNFASVGDTYDSVRDAFYSSSKPHPSWIFNESTANYDPPKPQPAPVEGSYFNWNEGTADWDQVTPLP